MKYLKGDEESEAKLWLEEAFEVAKRSLCLNRKCGTIIVKDGDVIGEGYNAPPLDNSEFGTCLDVYTYPQKLNFDRTCCVHAEWRAVMDALRSNPEKLKGARLYFASFDEKGEFRKSGKPFCTVCSRIVLDSGVAEFVLWHEEGVGVYSTDEYNKLSYEYNPKDAKI